MGLGILRDKVLGAHDVPGTALVLSSPSDRLRQLALDGRALKYDATGKILLIPQPSDDALDPLVRIPSLHFPAFPATLC
jgi:hypothetical protein